MKKIVKMYTRILDADINDDDKHDDSKRNPQKFVQMSDAELLKHFDDASNDVILSDDQQFVLQTMIPLAAAYDTIIDAVQGDTLDAKWSYHFDHFESTLAAFGRRFRQVYPPSKNTARRAFLIPKLRYLLHTVPIFIRHWGRSVKFAHEQSFEAVHHAFRMYLDQFQMFRSGRIVMARKKEEQQWHQRATGAKMTKDSSSRRSRMDARSVRSADDDDDEDGDDGDDDDADDDDDDDDGKHSSASIKAKSPSHQSRRKKKPKPCKCRLFLIYSYLF